jgi:hypothetical protein
VKDHGPEQPKQKAMLIGEGRTGKEIKEDKYG